MRSVTRRETSQEYIASHVMYAVRVHVALDDVASKCPRQIVLATSYYAV